MSLVTPPNLDQASIYSDLTSLDRIRQQGQTDELGAIKKAAQEFESFFMNMMLKTMRQASEVIGQDNPFGSQQEKMFTGMMDEQLAVDLSRGGHLKIADMMVEQLTRQYSKVENSEDIQIHLQNIKSAAEKAASGNLQPLAPVGAGKSVTPPLAPTNQDEQLLNPVATVKVKPEKLPLFNQAKDFIASLLPQAKQAAAKIGVDPKLLVAQAALETGWGKYVMHDEAGKPGFNFFGIKAGSNWQGGAIKIETLEVEQQRFKKVNASFRKYESPQHSLNDYADFVTSQPRYQSAVKAADNAENYLNELQESGYATDPDYAKKILKIYQDDSIQNFEQELQQSVSAD